MRIRKSPAVSGIKRLTLLVVVCIFSSCVAEDTDTVEQFARVGIGNGIQTDQADLQIAGNIHGGLPVYLDLVTVRQYPSHSFDAADPWSNNTNHTYTGVRLDQLLDFLGLAEDASIVDIETANDYSVPIRLADIKRYEYLLAYSADGVLFQDSASMKNRGTFAIAINFPAHPELDVQVYKHQLAWQVEKITLR